MRTSHIALLAALCARGLPAEESEPPRLKLSRISSPITVDGDLSDPGWKEATVIETFCEISPGDNVVPPVKAIARIGYDDRFFYASFWCADPDPRKIRAPYVDRDGISDDQDYVGILLDVENQRHAAIDFWIGPTGIQADSTRNWSWLLSHNDFASGFRDDQGFVPQVGYRTETANLSYRFFTSGLFSRLRPTMGVDYTTARDGGLLSRVYAPALNFQSRWAERRWIDETVNGISGRLFTADIARAKATYVFNARMVVRLIGQYVETTRDATLWTFPVAAKDGGFAGSALFSYKLNWQTVLFAGYGDNRTLREDGVLTRADRQFFLKVSYAFQR